MIVTPSIYGTDNRATLYGMKAYGKGARGVAVIDDKTSDSQLDEMGRAGIKGIRINLATANQNDASVGRKRFQDSVERVKGRGWHIQMYVAAPVIAGSKIWWRPRLSRWCSIISAAPRPPKGWSSPVGPNLSSS